MDGASGFTSAIVAPPVGGFYTRPGTTEDILDQMVGRLLDLFDIDSGNSERWGGMREAGEHRAWTASVLS